MTPWQWWATSACGRDDGEWELGEFDARDAAIAAANMEYADGEPFYVIEARSSTHARYATGNYDIVPFVRKQNEERLIASAIEARRAIDAEGGVVGDESAVANGETHK